MSAIENIRMLTVEESKDDYYKSLYDTYAKYFPDATDEALAIMVSIHTGICPYCNERPSGCQCWNDE